MALEITTHEEYESGTVYEFNGDAVYVPAGVTERVDIDIEDDHDAVRAVGSVHRETPSSIVSFEDNSRSAIDRAELWRIERVESRRRATPLASRYAGWGRSGEDTGDRRIRGDRSDGDVLGLLRVR